MADPITENLVEPVTEPVREAVGTVETATVDTMEEVRDALRLQGGRIDILSESLNRGLSDLQSGVDRLVEAATAVGTASVGAAADVAEAATEVPEAVTETVAATVEAAADPPKVRRRRLIGNRR
jgi:hypothetical protein